MCLIDVAHEHFITQTRKRSKLALINSMGSRANIWGRRLRAKKNKCPEYEIIHGKSSHHTKVFQFIKAAN